MRPEERDPAFLWEMVRAGRSIQRFVDPFPFEDYLGRDLERAAVERQFEILGKAARKMSPSFRAAHPEIPWERMVGLRNILAHRYYDIDHRILWEIIHNVLPGALDQLERLMPPAPSDDENR